MKKLLQLLIPLTLVTSCSESEQPDLKFPIQSLQNLEYFITSSETKLIDGVGLNTTNSFYKSQF